jgi:hypothetical protein
MTDGIAEASLRPRQNCRLLVVDHNNRGGRVRQGLGSLQASGCKRKRTQERSGFGRPVAYGKGWFAAKY